MASAPSELILQVLGRIPLFRGLSPTQVRLIHGMCEHKAYAADEELCRQDAPAEWVHILVAGELTQVTLEGKPARRLLPVSTVGETQVLLGQPCSHSIFTSKPSHVFRIPRFQFERMLRRDADAQLKIFRNLAEHLAGQVDDDTTAAQLSESQLDRQRLEVRVAALERQQRQQGQKLEAALELLSERAEISRQEAETHIGAQLEGAIPRVLIVDDEPEFRRFVCEALAAFMVVEASSGREALDMIQEEPLDLIIADIRMPEMDGCTLLTNLRSKYPDLPVLAVSGYLGAEDLQSYGFDGFIDKPVPPQDLQGMVEMALARSN